MSETQEELNRRREEILNILGSGIRIESLDDFVGQLKVRGIGIVITEHKVREALALCDRA